MLASLAIGGPLLAADRISLLSRSFTEISVPVVLPARPAPGDLSEIDSRQAEWSVDYDTEAAASWVIDLPPLAAAAERFDVWLKPDGSGNVVTVEAFYTPTGAWLEQAACVLHGTDWRHLVIPASNPLHAFHPEVPRLRLSVQPGPDAKETTGQLVLRDAELARTAPVSLPLPTARPPAPVFDTWGGPRPERFAQGVAAGVTMHLIPVDFPDGRPVAERVRYAVRAISQAKQADLNVGLAFYPTPSASWLAANRDLLCRGPATAYDRPGGAFLSPWNPVAEQLFCDHIREVLRFLEREGLLASIDLVELCPGEEGEISFEWSQVWAFDRHALAAYREFVRRHYDDDIAAVNRDWATDYASFNAITPPHDYAPDREHWVFTEFYRASLLRRCAALADAVEAVFRPKYWLWLPHSIGNARPRFFSARYPAYYVENLRRLGCGDYMQIAALDWQTPEDIRQLRAVGVRTIAEVDVRPSAERLQWTFQQADRFGCDGVFLGVVEGLVDSESGLLTAQGRLARTLTDQFSRQWQLRDAEP